MSNLMGKDILISLAGMGVKVEDMRDSYDELYIKISVPEFSDHVNVKGNEMTGNLLVKRLQIEGVIRKGETWTDSDRKFAEENMKRHIHNI